MELRLTTEDVTDYKEAIATELGFCGESGVIRNQANVLVGFYQITVEDSGYIDLTMLEFLEEHQMRGYGRAFIKELFSMYPTLHVIKGQATDESVGFYASLDATITNACDDCDNYDCGLHPESDDPDEASRGCEEVSFVYFEMRREAV